MSKETLRQVIIMLGLTLCGISDGFVFGQMSGMINSLRGKDDQMSLSDDNVSWIASIINITCPSGLALAALLMEKLGRRRSITTLTLPVIITWLMVYYGKDFITFAISRVIVGCSFGAVSIVSYISSAEYASPRVRAILGNIVAIAGPSVGISLGHILCILFHWRTVALIGLIPAILSALLPFFFIESPYWLAFKGRFEECEVAFRKLHGRTDSSEAELKLLVELERQKQNLKSRQKISIFTHCKRMVNAFFQKSMIKVMFLGFGICIYRVAGGKILYSTMALTMLQEITGSSNILLFTLVVDGCLILGSILPCLLFIKFNMRPILFTLGLVTNITLIVLSICIYFKPNDNIYFSWMCVSLLAFYLVTANAGPLAVIEVLISEIFPLEIKSYCIFIFSTLSGVINFLSIKYAQIMFDTIGYYSVFLLNSSIALLCLLIFWFYLPETKGRTLQEIELYFKNNRFSDDKTLDVEQLNHLLEIKA
ncbi:uncharacterized protein [Battus philenor]|uniref:uncharacterized protein n=1 Tax=Battus philenor TaxID=42288 RepID=UPI0035CF7A5C